MANPSSEMAGALVGSQIIKVLALLIFLVWLTISGLPFALEALRIVMAPFHAG